MSGWQRFGLRLVALLLVAAFLLGLYSTFQSSRTVQRWLALFGPEESGSWSALRIDGQPVSGEDYQIFVDGGEVRGGRDGCNDWSYRDERDRNGARTIFSTLQACPEDDPVRLAYYALAREGRTRLELRADGTLRLIARGHEGLFRRCYWDVERTPTSKTDVCRPE